MKEVRTAAVTGGASGIGFASARALALAGCRVVVGDRDAARLERAKAAIVEEVDGADVVTVTVDISDEEQVASFVASAAEGGSGLDVMVACAAIYEPCDFIEMDGSTWDATANINLRGTVLCAAEAARQMRDGGGSIVLVSSIDSLISEPKTAAYSAAKSAINSLSRSMAVDLSRYQISVNAIAPGWVVTPMTEDDISTMPETAFDVVNPLRRAARPEEIAGVIKYLALEAPPFLTGSTIFVDGGQSALAPMPS